MRKASVFAQCSKLSTLYFLFFSSFRPHARVSSPIVGDNVLSNTLSPWSISLKCFSSLHSFINLWPIEFISWHISWVNSSTLLKFHIYPCEWHAINDLTASWSEGTIKKIGYYRLLRMACVPISEGTDLLCILSFFVILLTIIRMSDWINIRLKCRIPAYSDKTSNTDANTKCWRVASPDPLHEPNRGTDRGRATNVRLTVTVYDCGHFKYTISTDD